MPNKQYVKGRRKEYKICNQLKEQGWDIVQRTAGSHSPIDIIAIHLLKREILFIQSKPDNYIKTKEYERFLDEIWGSFNVKFEIR